MIRTLPIRLFIFVLAASILSCNGEPQKGNTPNTTKTPPPSAGDPGKALHDTYCGACHMLPSPKDLDKTTWKQTILVRMGAYMGIYNDNVRYYDQVPEKWLEPGEGGERVKAAGIYPEKPMLSRQEWEQLSGYIVRNAPQKTSGPTGLMDIEHGIPGFKVKAMQPDTSLQPLVTSVGIDPAARRIYAGFFQQDLISVDLEGKVKDRKENLYGPVQIMVEKGRISMADIGSIKGSDSPKGKFFMAGSFKDMIKGRSKLRLDLLQRPVHSHWADLDADGDEDLVLCEFGYHFGELAWHENPGNANGKWKRHTLWPDDGAVAAIVADFSEDGLPDIIALMANSDERLDLYLNKGNGEFEKKQLFRFNPTYGNTALEMVDFNGDGRMDFLTANGDNGDYIPVLKPHHGIRLYLNQGNAEFEEALYLPMNGAYGMRARDFDQDGDIDIAAVSFYPDYQTRAEESFVFFQNQGHSLFRAFTFPEVGLSRWMVMDAGDADGDGDEDIVLGGFNVKSGDASDATYEGWMKNNVPVLLLENTLK